MAGNNVNWPAPLTRLNPWYPGQFGVPGTDSETGLRLNTEGTIFWVDPNHPDANDQKDGTNPTSPLRTVAAALTKCEAYRGDVIAVMHNGFWTYGDTTAAHVQPINEAVTVDVPGVRIVGISSGTLGVPWVSPADGAVCITINELDVTVEGFNFWDWAGRTGASAIAATWTGVAEFGENFTIRHCYFYNFDTYGIDMDYTYNCVIEDCMFFNLGTCAIYNNGTNGDPDFLIVRNCWFSGNVSDIDLADTSYALIEGNRMLESTAAITLDGGSYCQILDNTIGGDPNTAIVITGGSYNVILNNAIYADPTGTNNMINATGGASNLVGGNYLSCSIAQYDTTCSDATSGSWGANHCNNGDTTAAPT